MAMSRIVCDVLVSGSMQPKKWTVVDGGEGLFLHHPALYGDTTKYPGGAEGRPFYVWPTMPAGTLLAVDYSSAAICGANATATQAAANAFKASPTVLPNAPGDEGVLIYA